MNIQRSSSMTNGALTAGMGDSLSFLSLSRKSRPEQRKGHEQRRDSEVVSMEKPGGSPLRGKRKGRQQSTGSRHEIQINKYKLTSLYVTDQSGFGGPPRQLLSE